MTVANNASFGTDIKLEDELRRVMRSQLSVEQDSDPLNTLDPALIHIFRLSSSNYIPFGVKDQLTLLETRRLDGTVATSY